MLYFGVSLEGGRRVSAATANVFRRIGGATLDSIARLGFAARFSLAVVTHLPAAFRRLSRSRPWKAGKAYPATIAMKASTTVNSTSVTPRAADVLLSMRRG